MSLSNEQWDFTKDISQLIKYASSIDIKLTPGECFRPQLMQEHYYDTGKSRTRHSLHNSKLAMDFSIFINGHICNNNLSSVRLGIFWEALDIHNEWGGFWKFVDINHFQRRRTPRPKRRGRTYDNLSVQVPDLR